MKETEPPEQDVVRLLVERVEYDGRAGTVSVTFHPGGDDRPMAGRGQEAAA